MKTIAKGVKSGEVLLRLLAVQRPVDQFCFDDRAKDDVGGFVRLKTKTNWGVRRGLEISTARIGVEQIDQDNDSRLS